MSVAEFFYFIYLFFFFLVDFIKDRGLSIAYVAMQDMLPAGYSAKATLEGSVPASSSLFPFLSEAETIQKFSAFALPLCPLACSDI